MVSIQPGHSWQNYQKAPKFAGETSGVGVQPGQGGEVPFLAIVDPEPVPAAPNKGESPATSNAHKKTFAHRMKMAAPILVGNVLQLGALGAWLKKSPKLAIALLIPGVAAEIAGHVRIAKDQWFARKKSIGTELVALPMLLGSAVAATQKKVPLAAALAGGGLFVYGMACQKFNQAWKEG